MHKTEKQEPVAAQSRFSGDEWTQCSVEHAKMVMANPHEWKNYEFRLLYTTPPAPQRQWVSLTDEDRDSMWRKAYQEEDRRPAFHWYEQGLQDAEAKLREKNGGQA